VGREAGDRPVRAGGGHRQADPRRPALPAQDGGRILDRVPRLRALVARGGHRKDVVEEGGAEGAHHAAVDAVAGQAQVQHVGAAARREVDAAEEVTLVEAPVARCPDCEHAGVAGHSLAAHAVSVDGRDQAGDEGAVSDEVGHLGALRVGVVRAGDAARHLGVAHVQPGVHHRDGALRPPAGGGQRRGGADVVVEPRVLDAGDRVDAVERVGGDVQPGVPLDVGHAPFATQRACERSAGRDRRGEHADRLERLGLGAEPLEHARDPGHVGVRPRADQDSLRPGAARDAGELGRGRCARAARLGKRQGHDAGRAR
jgi:hypothetical protein